MDGKLEQKPDWMDEQMVETRCGKMVKDKMLGIHSAKCSECKLRKMTAERDTLKQQLASYDGMIDKQVENAELKGILEEVVRECELCLPAKTLRKRVVELINTKMKEAGISLDENTRPPTEEEAEAVVYPDDKNGVK